MTVQLHLGNSVIVLSWQVPPGSIDSIVTDPPYGLVSTVKRFGKAGSAPAKSDGPTGVYKRASAGFMGQQWDGTGIEQNPDFWRLCLDVLKPGGYLLAFGGTRTWHRIAVAIEDAGFEVRDTIMWLYGTGFPKSHDVAVSIDKAARGVPHGGVDPTSPNHGKYRTQATEGTRGDGDAGQGYGAGPGQFMRETGQKNSRELTPEAAAWQGWGTALKPAWEPIIVARKPLVGTVAANVLAHGVGAMNIDDCRVATDDRLGGGAEKATRPDQKGNEGWTRPWMENAEAQAAHAKRVRDNVVKAETLGRWPANVIGDDSLPQDFWRFFYTTKASKKDRNTDWQGCEIATKNEHPTVKPTDLMAWLVRLVTPPGGTVLDPFMGSGSTGKAARMEGFNFVGIEADKRFFQIAMERCGADNGSDFETALADLLAAVQRNKEARRGWMEE